MPDLETVGDAATGAVLARAVEPGAGEADDGHTHETKCLNCGAQLLGGFCHECGQRAHVHRSLKGFFHDLLHGVLHFEGKIWRTLPKLIGNPGDLTRRYIDGERARFVSPIALFLFSVFLMFAVFTLIGGPFNFDYDAESSVAARAEAERDLRRETVQSEATLTRLRAERQRLLQAREATTEVDAEIAAAERELAIERQLYNQALNLIAADERREAEQARAEGAREGRAPPAAQAPVRSGNRGLEINSNWPWLDDGLRKASENPSLLLYKLQTNAYKFSWALIPISVPFLWLLFLHRRRYRRYKAYDHTVFVTYSIAFMSLALIVLSLLRPLGLPEGLIGVAITFIPPIHMYRQLRGAYALSRWSAIWRTFVLLNFAFIAASLFFMLLLTLGVLG